MLEPRANRRARGATRIQSELIHTRRNSESAKGGKHERSEGTAVAEPHGDKLTLVSAGSSNGSATPAELHRHRGGARTLGRLPARRCGNGVPTRSAQMPGVMRVEPMARMERRQLAACEAIPIEIGVTVGSSRTHRRAGAPTTTANEPVTDVV